MSVEAEDMVNISPVKATEADTLPVAMKKVVNPRGPTGPNGPTVAISTTLVTGWVIIISAGQLLSTTSMVLLVIPMEISLILESIVI